MTWWIFELFLLYTWKNQIKTEYPEEILGSAHCFYDGANLGYGFSPLWKNDQLRRWVPGTRASLELYLKEEVHAWELEPVRHSCSLAIFSPETNCRYSPDVKFCEPVLHSSKLNELERKQTRLSKVLHGITSPLQYINIYIYSLPIKYLNKSQFISENLPDRKLMTYYCFFIRPPFTVGRNIISYIIFHLAFQNKMQQIQLKLKS